MLLVYGANPNVRGERPRCFASKFAYIVLQDETGRTALQAASLHESLEISKLLLANGADPNAEGECTLPFSTPLADIHIANRRRVWHRATGGRVFRQFGDCPTSS
jgi:ankyrin repeat protein